MCVNQANTVSPQEQPAPAPEWDVLLTDSRCARCGAQLSAGMSALFVPDTQIAGLGRFWCCGCASIPPDQETLRMMYWRLVGMKEQVAFCEGGRREFSSLERIRREAADLERQFFTLLDAAL